MLKCLARRSHGWRVDQRHHFFNVIHYNPVEKGLVSILERDQVEVTTKIGLFITDISQYTQLLFGGGMNTRREQTGQAQCFTISFRECGSFVSYGVMENFYTAMHCGHFFVFHDSIL
jgi:hypothetical protein